MHQPLIILLKHKSDDATPLFKTLHGNYFKENEDLNNSLPSPTMSSPLITSLSLDHVALVTLASLLLFRITRLASELRPLHYYFFCLKCSFLFFFFFQVFAQTSPSQWGLPDHFIKITTQHFWSHSSPLYVVFLISLITNFII